jgi:hypothetical protein
MSNLPSSRADRLRRAFTFRGGAIAVVVVGAIGLSACGGSSGSSATSTTTASSSSGAATTTPAGGTATNNAALARYTACLKQHGVTLPSRGAGGAPGAGGGAPPTTTGGSATPPQQPAGGVNNAKFQKAQTACASLRPKGARGGGPGFGGAQNSAAFAAYRNCLTIHGVKASSLRSGNGGTAAASAKVKKAMTACASLRPAQANPPATTTTGASQ